MAAAIIAIRNKNKNNGLIDTDDENEASMDGSGFVEMLPTKDSFHAEIVLGVLVLG